MPTQKEVTIRYWGWCKKWGVPYPCRKTKTETRWCYFFNIWVQTNYVVLARHKACEGNMQYSWWGSGFGRGTIVHIPQEKCFDEKKSGTQGCGLIGTDIPFVE